VTDAETDASIDPEALAVMSGTTTATIHRLVSLGILGPAEEGRFGPGDVSRARFALALEASGISLDDVARGIADGRLSLAFAGRLMADPIALRAERWEEACARAGVTIELAQSLRAALGLPAFDPQEQIREDDAEVLDLWATALSSLSPDMVLRGAHVFTTNLRPLAEFRRELFADQVEEPMLAAGMSHQQMLDAAAQVRGALQALSFRLIHLIDHQLLEREVFDNLIGRFEHAMREAGVGRSRSRSDPGIAFVDVSGYTQLVTERGDEAAALLAGSLTEQAVAVAGTHRGRLIKSLGDGVLLRFDSSTDAVRGVVTLVERFDPGGPSRLHAGIATGPVVIRDGDYFGTTVNVASRLADHAERGEILVTEEVTRSGSDDVTFEPRGEVNLQGIEGTTRIFQVATSTA
jgi:adenylate cyclase